jgi:peptidoglycan/xylan/chitin deacetylase (PgdA/CDA1 family)
MEPNAPYIWPENNRCAFLFSVDVDAESPFIWEKRGQKVTQLALPEARRFGVRQGLWRMLDMLDSFSCRASFYVPGVVAQSYPHIMPGLLERGHEVGLHGYYHELIQTLDTQENREIMERSLALFKSQTGLEPAGYRSPAWEMTQDQLALLKELGLKYDSSLMGYEHPYSIDGVCEIPVQWLIDDAIYFKFMGDGSDRWHPANPVSIAQSWIEEFEGIREHGGLFCLTVHPWISGRAQRIRLLRGLLEHVSSYDDVWWATAAELAEYHAGSENAARFQVAATTVDTDF